MSKKKDDFPKDPQMYLIHSEKTEYIQSYKQAAEDKNILLIAEEGMEDYLEQLQEE